MKSESFIYQAPNTASPIVILCDHATNIVPEWIGNQVDGRDGDGAGLGIDEADMNRHIAYDVGALGVAQHLAKSFDAHLLATQFSRLVIDPNRGHDDPTLIMKIYDQTIIPANRDLSNKARDERLNRLHRPYNAQITKVLDDVRASGVEPLIISIHSFTKQLRGREPRPWHVGFLSADDRRLSDRLIHALEAQGEYCVGDNEPYHGALVGDTLDQHGIRKGLHHCLIEVRNDLIEKANGQAEWGATLYRVLSDIFMKEEII